MTTEYKWYSRILLDIFRLLAAGRMSNALMIRIPTQRMENIIITAIKTAKISSMYSTFTPLLFANEEFMLIAWSLLNAKTQKIIANTNTIPNNRISFGVMLKTSPTNKFEYFEKLPPDDKITRPNAVPNEENTEIIVSVDTVFFRFIRFSPNANITANISIETFLLAKPNTTPIPIPVYAECPNASEKNAIF